MCAERRRSIGLAAAMNWRLLRVGRRETQMPSDKACPIRPLHSSCCGGIVGLSRGARRVRSLMQRQDFARRTRKCHPHSHGKKSPIFVPNFYRALASPRDLLMGYFSDPGSPARSVAHPVCRQRSNLWLSEVWLTSVSLLLASLSGPFGPQVVWGLWGRPFVIAGASILIATLISARNCQLIVVRRMPHQVPYRKRLISLIRG